MREPDEIALGETAERERLARLEERVTRLETHLGFGAAGTTARAAEPPPALSPVFLERPATKEEFEFELGQHWFALAGIVILTAGVALLLSLPYTQLPAAVPAVTGFALAALLFLAAHLCPRSIGLVAGYLRGAAMAVLAIAAVRLFLFGTRPALDSQSLPGIAVLLAVTTLNVTIGWRRKSPWLIGVALALGCATALAGGASLLVMASLTGVVVVSVAASRRFPWPGLLLLGLGLTHATYFAWAAGNPLRTGAVHFVNTPGWAPLALLAWIMLLGAAPWLTGGARSEALTHATAFTNCALGYGAFLVHTAAAFRDRFAFLNVVAVGAMLALAIGYFARTASRVPTFFYAMTGYGALSLAILKVSSAPNVFVWLSVQSVLVVATAIWFRSRFIVVANFFIFAAIVGGYVVLNQQERGLSLGFGLVALATARILNWQQHRLELKTELMRNTYLASAFILFPYAVYHLVPVRYVALAWTALAAGYYVMNLAVRNPKYRWMGHGTLMLTTVYVIGIGVSRFEPVYRVLSFLVLGATLLTVSLLFARARRRSTAGAAPADAGDAPPPAPK